MKEIRTVDAIGHVLCHDLTQIIPGKFKGAKFKKGHVVTAEDIPVLLGMGKENLYVWEKTEDILHEDEAAKILCDLAIGAHMEASAPSEGKIEIFAACDGLLKVDSAALRTINSTPQMMIAARHGNTPVRRGDKLAGTRIIPLVIEKKKMDDLRKRTAEVTGGRSVLTIRPFVHRKVGIVTTGSEVYHGRIRDSFTPVLLEKLKEYDVELIGHEMSDDNDRMTTAAIRKLLGMGADLVLCTGGMSVDPDDRTPLAIRNAGTSVVTYGAPVLPGAMFLLSYLKEPDAQQSAFPDDAQQSILPDDAQQSVFPDDADTERAVRKEDGQEEPVSGKTRAVCGLPGCVMYAKRTIFDLLLPRIMADDPITADEIYGLGEGGLCLGCDVCTYPNCGFGKGK